MRQSTTILEPQNYSVKDFCKTHGISRAKFYLLLKENLAPAIMKVGRRTLISKEAAAKWRERMQTITQHKSDAIHNAKSFLVSEAAKDALPN